MTYYFEALLAVPGADKDALRTEQRRWLARRDWCSGSQIARCLESTYEERVRHLSTTFLEHAKDDPVIAAKTLRSLDTLSAKMGLALIDRVLLPQTKDSDAELRALLDEIAELTEGTPGLADISSIDGYDGSVTKLIPYLQATSLRLGGFDIPCAFIERAPALVHAVDPIFGSTMDSFLPTANCPVEHFPVPVSVERYLKGAAQFDGGFRDRCTGTMAHGYGRAVYLHDLMRRVMPRLFLEEARVPWGEQAPTLDRLPLETWSYHGLWNRQAFLSLKPLFLQARSDLASHYQQRFGMTEGEAFEAAHRAIWVDMFEGWWSKMQPEPVRKAILDGRSVEEVEEARKLSVARPRQDRLGDPAVYIRANAGEPENLLMIAMTRPEIVGLLIRLGENANGPNAFGKTPLMAAAQYDDIASTRLLLAAHADPKAATYERGDVPGNSPRDERNSWSGCGLYAIAYGERTALMYAAANASVPLIELLVVSGADIAAKDSQGRTALDYLLGKGPVPPNPKLSGDDLARAQHLLTP